MYDHGLPPETFDVSYSRWLLMHLNQPVDAMRSIYTALKPGGLIVCEEADMSAIYTEPPSAYHEFVDETFVVGAARGVDYAGGRRLHRWASEAGFDVVRADAYHPHYLTGEHKGFWSWTFRESGANLVKEGAMTDARYDELYRGDARGRRRSFDPGRSRAHASTRCAQAGATAERIGRQHTGRANLARDCQASFRNTGAGEAQDGGSGSPASWVSDSRSRAMPSPIRP